MNKFKELTKNRILNNFIVLLTGDSVSSVLNIISTALIVNAIGLSQNGIILMIQSYSLLFDQIFNFKIFEGLIKYISVSLYNKDYEKAKSYVKQGLILDFITAIVAMIIGILFINIATTIMGWDEALKSYLLLYMISVGFNISGVCIGILRVFNKFNYISYINVSGNLAKTILFMVGLVCNLKFNYYFFVELMIVLCKYIMYMVFSYNTLIKNGLRGSIRSKLKFDKEFIVFSLNTNLASTLDLPVNTITTFIMNKYLGFESISVYKIFEKIASLVGKFSSPFNQILYPELNSYVAKKESEKAIKLSKKISVWISGMGIILLVLVLITYEFWLPILIPNANRYIYSLSIYILFIIFTNSTATVHSLFMALGYIKYVVPTLFLINSIYIVTIVPFIKYFELNGVIGALFIQAILVVVTKLIIMKNNNYRVLN